MKEKKDDAPLRDGALLIVDVQNDFLPGGNLAVPDGDAVVAPINRMIEFFRSAARPVFASRDWHPAKHGSFVESGGPWPPHCIRDTRGAAFPETLKLPPDAHIISKASKPDKDAYSAFDGTDLYEKLRHLDITRLYITGLATDYCVRASVVDALTLGFEAMVVVDCVRAVNLNPKDGEKAMDEMKRRGALLLCLVDVVKA